MLKTTVLVLPLFIIVAMLYVRLSPLDVRALHVDPETAEQLDTAGSVLMREDGDLEPYRSDLEPQELAARLEAIILATPRTERLDGSLEAGFASYVTRSAIWGFPDIASVKVRATDGGGSEVILLSRLRFGKYDMGVNRARVEDWLSQL